MQTMTLLYFDFSIKCSSIVFKISIIIFRGPCFVIVKRVVERSLEKGFGKQQGIWVAVLQISNILNIKDVHFKGFPSKLQYYYDYEIQIVEWMKSTLKSFYIIAQIFLTPTWKENHIAKVFSMFMSEFLYYSKDT